MSLKGTGFYQSIHPIGLYKNYMSDFMYMFRLDKMIKWVESAPDERKNRTAP